MRKSVNCAFERTDSIVVFNDSSSLKAGIIKIVFKSNSPTRLTFQLYISKETLLDLERTVLGMPNQPLVSIILPAYNAENTIEATLSSLTNQTLQSIEIVCVNDGSTDGTNELLAKAARADNRIKVISTPNRGSCKAREEGLAQASGSYIGFCDADDLPLPDMYEALYENAIRNSSDIAVCPYFRKKNGIVLATEMLKPKRIALPVNSKSGWIIAVNTALWNKLYKKEAITSRIRLNTPPKIGEDAIFFLSILPGVKRLSFVHEPKYLYQVQENSAMSSVSEEETDSALEAWIKLRSYIAERDMNYLQIIDSAAFVHLGVSLPAMQLKQGDYRLAKKTLTNLDKNFPLHHRSNFFAANYLKEYPDFMKLTYAAHKLAQIGLLMPSLKAYQKLISILGSDIKW